MDQDSVTDERVGTALLAGLIVSMSVMILGLILASLRTGQRLTQVVPIATVPSRVTKGDAAGVLDLGILLLFATPVLGVVTALIEFLRRRDRPFVCVVVVLLGLIALGCAVALR